MLQVVFATCATKTVDGNTEIAFGLDDGLPWGHIRQDMINFRNRTKNTVLIMGAKTWESLNAPLPGRRSVVVISPGRGKPKTKNGTSPDEIMYPDEFISFLEGEIIVTSTATSDYPWDTIVDRNTYDVSIIGGKGLIEQAVPHADLVVHTSIIKKHRVNSTVQMTQEFLNTLPMTRMLKESHWYQCDELTQITESVYGEFRG